MRTLTFILVMLTCFTTAARAADAPRKIVLIAGKKSHGPAGNGGKGANLAVPSLPRAQTDIALYKVIRYGLPETEMPGANMTPSPSNLASTTPPFPFVTF